VEQLVLTARVAWEDPKYVARVENLPLEAEGDSVEEAQDELIQTMRTWIATHDGGDSLEHVLAQAGFPGVEENTELQLEFVEGL
jgi:hypothetical protein